MGKKRDQVKRAYPQAICITWGQGDNAYQIWKDNNAVQFSALGRGASPSLAWADAAKRLHVKLQRKGM